MVQKIPISRFGYPTCDERAQHLAVARGGQPQFGPTPQDTGGDSKIVTAERHPDVSNMEGIELPGIDECFNYPNTLIKLEFVPNTNAKEVTAHEGRSRCGTRGFASSHVASDPFRNQLKRNPSIETCSEISSAPRCVSISDKAYAGSARAQGIVRHRLWMLALMLAKRSRRKARGSPRSGPGRAARTRPYSPSSRGAGWQVNGTCGQAGLQVVYCTPLVVLTYED